MPKHWADRQLDLLQSEWRDLDRSLSEIAAAINAQTGARFSRNAIAGQAKRLGLPLRRQPNRNKGPRPASARPATRIVAVNLRRRKARPVSSAPFETEPADAPPHLGLTLFDLTSGTCRYPRGVERFTFCGQPAERDRPYCGFHTRLCYAPKERNLERNTDRSLVTSERRAA
jgi:GcrA cell cycle regulator